jgi:hypothetical protein
VFLIRDLQTVLQVLEAWVEDPDTSGMLWPKLERGMTKNLQLALQTLADWHQSVEADEPFWVAVRGNTVMESVAKID